MSAVRVLVVDDSVTMRMMLRRLLSADPGIEVVGVAEDAEQADALVKSLRPDVITLDVEMPGMNGLEFLERLMRSDPLPVVMCSTLTGPEAVASIEAMRLGAVDCIEKPRGNVMSLYDRAEELRATVIHAARANVRGGRPSPERPPAPDAAPRPAVADSGRAHGLELIVIGSSTGGVEALFQILPHLRADLPPILMVQHMPEKFTSTFATRLDRASRISVAEAVDGTLLRRGHAYLAPGGPRHLLLGRGSELRARLMADDPVHGHRPAVDPLFKSAMRLGDRVMAVVLTGMGEDGARGMLALRVAGALTLAQDRASSVVFGMPRAAIDLGAAQDVVPLSAIAERINAAAQPNRKAA